MAAFPTLYTERLCLRDWCTTDADALYVIVHDGTVTIQGGWEPHGSPEISRQYMENGLRDHSWVIALRETDMVIGFVKLLPDHNRGALKAGMVSYLLGKSHWGCGYMTEALETVVGYAFEKLGLDLLSAFRYPDNLRSARVLERCGFTYEGTISQGCRRYDGARLDAVCYAITREEYHMKGRKSL